jgi:hypothetical protein
MYRIIGIIDGLYIVQTPKGVKKVKVIESNKKGVRDEIKMLCLQKHVIHLPSSTLSKKPSSLLLLVGCCNFPTAFTSICLTLSRVTINLLPTSSRVYV